MVTFDFVNNSFFDSFMFEFKLLLFKNFRQRGGRFPEK